MIEGDGEMVGEGDALLRYNGNGKVLKAGGDFDEKVLNADRKALAGGADALKGEGVQLKSKGKTLKDDRVAINVKRRR